MKESTLRDSLIISFASVLVLAILLFSGLVQSTAACLALGISLLIVASAFTALLNRLISRLSHQSPESKSLPAEPSVPARAA